MGELIKDNKNEVRKGVLGVLLQTGNDENNRKLLQQTEVIKYCLRYMKEEVNI